MSLLALFLVMIVLAVVPSTSVALVVTRSATRGFQSGAAAAAGIVVGDLIFLGLAILGMAALAQSLGSLFVGVKIAAGMYLIFLGITLILPQRQLRIHTSMSSVSAGTSFLAGLLVTLSDLKAIFFYASLLPVFIDLSNIATSSVISVAMITVVSVGGVKLAYAALANQIMAKMRERRIARGGEVAAGGLLVGAGTYMVVKS